MSKSLDMSLQAFVDVCEKPAGVYLYDSDANKAYVLTRDSGGFKLTPLGVRVGGNILSGHPTINQPYIMTVDLELSSPQLLVLCHSEDNFYLQLVIPSCIGLTEKARLKQITHICTIHKGFSRKDIIPVVPNLYTYQ